MWYKLFLNMNGFLFLLLPLLALVGCGTPNPQKPHNDKLMVLSTTAILGDIVQQIAGESLATEVLMGRSLDPHSYEFVKGDDEKFAEASLIFYTGLGLEHGGSVRRALDQAPQAVALGDLLARSDPQAIIRVEGQVDPHIWMDVSLWQRIIPLIVDHLSALDPSHRQEFGERGVLLKKRLAALHCAICEKIKALPPEKRYLVTCHDAFNYFARAYLAKDQWSNHVFAPEGLSPDGQISISALRHIITAIQKHHIPVVFPEAYVSLDPLKKIVEGASWEGITVKIAPEPLYSDSLAPEGGYEEMMNHNAQVIYEQLAG